MKRQWRVDAVGLPQPNRTNPTTTAPTAPSSACHCPMTIPVGPASAAATATATRRAARFAMGGVMTPGTVAVVPNAPGTPRRTIRIPDDLWDAATAKADKRGESVSDVIRHALERYVGGK